MRVDNLDKVGATLLLLCRFLLELVVGSFPAAGALDAFWRWKTWWCDFRKPNTLPGRNGLYSLESLLA